ncbi:autotransporter outer membrane beta-barrel domain-containing protein [Microvirga sp. 0TCS3.31]
MSATPIAEQQVVLSDGNSVSIWTDVSHIRTKDKRFLSPSHGRAWQSTTGIDYVFGQTLTIGGGISVARAHTTQFALPGRSETDSVVGFARATAYFFNNFNASIIAGYGRGETDGSRFFLGIPDVYSQDSSVAFVGAQVGAEFENRGFFVSPSVRLLVSRTDGASVPTSLGAIVLGPQGDLTRLSLGGDIGYRMAVGGLTIAPAIRAFLVHDFDLPIGYTDRTALDLSAVLNVQSGNLNLGVEALQTFGRADLSNQVFRGYAMYRF